MLELKQTQKLLPVLTQQLQQAIRLLQLSRLELVEAIEQELEENPVLEVEEREIEEIEERQEEAGGEDDEVIELLDRFTSSEGGSAKGDEDAPEYENMVQNTYNLGDYLRWQVCLSPFEPDERAAAEWIIQDMDENGYLLYPPSELSAVSGLPTELLEDVLKKIQRLDPPGIGARDLKECILLQYEERGIRDPIVEDLLNTHFELLMKGAFKEIAMRTGFPLDLIKRAFEMIKAFDPKPGRNYSNEFVTYIVPDVYVVRGESGFEVFLGDDNIPELRLSRYYLELYMSKDINGNTKRYIKKKIKQAEWFITSIKQRQKTLLSVSRSIVKFQEEFFEEGLKALKPLVLRDVARDVGVHESTVSRVTSNKYMATPHGIFELKFFFPTGIGNDEGELLSTNIIKDMILRYTEEEDKEAPLTDDAIVTMLKERHNIKIARRTVAKYRELLNIPSSRERKRSREWD